MNEEALRKRCAKAFQEPNETLLALKWCTKKKTMKDVFKKIGFKFLDETSNDKDWNKLINESYGSSSGITVDDAKNFCQDIGNINTTDDDFIVQYEDADEGCVIPID